MRRITRGTRFPRGNEALEIPADMKLTLQAAHPKPQAHGKDTAPAAAKTPKTIEIPTSKHERNRKRDASALAPQVPGNGAADADQIEADTAPREATPAGVKGAPWHQTLKPWKPQQQQGNENQERTNPQS